jgi:hypothetical protein
MKFTNGYHAAQILMRYPFTEYHFLCSFVCTTNERLHCSCCGWVCFGFFTSILHKENKLVLCVLSQHSFGCN